MTSPINPNEKRYLQLNILPQPDESTCGPTCLHAVYRYYGLELPLEQIINEIRSLKEGGTLAVFLACHALRHNFNARIYTYNLQVFDPTWFMLNSAEIRHKLELQLEAKNTKEKLKVATSGYLEFLNRGGQLLLADLNPSLIRRFLKKGIPILTGLSATFLYRVAREYGPDSIYDDIRGDPSGHFVILAGYEMKERKILIVDPLHPNPIGPGQYYEIPIDRVISAILLGILTYDANLLIIEPK